MNDPERTMNEESAGRELAAAFHRLVEPEPPFRTDLHQALRAAEQDGRRRRTRTLAVRGAATVLAIAASTALVVAWPSRPTSLAPPAVVVPTDGTPTLSAATPAPSVTTPSPTRTTSLPTVTPTRTVVTTTPVDVTPTPTRATSSTPTLGTMARLERLARQIAAPAGGVVTVPTRDAIDQNVVVEVETDQGYVQVSARLADDTGTMDLARAMCVDEGDTCTTQWSSASSGVWSRVFADTPGRENLLFVTTYPQAPPLWVGVTNFHASGTKPLGPTWKEAGITVSRLRQAEADSGLNVTRTSPGP